MKFLVVLVGLVVLKSNATELSADGVLRKLVKGNKDYVTEHGTKGDISPARRQDTFANGQHPYAVVLTCSDSRVPVEHIFNAGIGDIFVVRTAGNVVSDFELGSIEYGVEHTGAKVVLVMGHTSCGAVAAAMGGHAEGHIESIVQEIKSVIGDETNSSVAEDLNIAHSKEKILNSSIITHLVAIGEVLVLGAKYDIQSGAVTLLDKITPQAVLQDLIKGNEDYVAGKYYQGDTSLCRRVDTAVHGQHPYAVVLTCSDSRVPVEHIFNAGVGDIFVIRTAGNVISDFELGSIEYGVEHSGAKVVLVMGHTNCGAVAAAIGGGAEGYIESIVDEIRDAIGTETNATIGENLNVQHSKLKVANSDIIKDLAALDEVIVVGAKYNIQTGVVTFGL